MTNAVGEHIEYLTLPGRNALYRQAIAAALRPGDTVADLGCGVGVLGLFCLEAGASHCWGIDSSEAIHLAREAMQRAGLAERYSCVADSTFRTELPARVDLIICDHVGYMGFDYGIIRLMRDARARFLKPGGRMIPQGLDLIAAAVESDDCRTRAARWGQPDVPEAFHWIETLDRNQRSAVTLDAAALLGAPSVLGSIDLAEDEPALFRFDAMLKIERAGRFDGFAGWFDCTLADGVRMTNSPVDPASIQRSQAFFPAQESFAVIAGDEIAISLRFRADGEEIAWTIRPPGGTRPHRMATFNSRALAPQDLARDPARVPVLSPLGAARAYVLSLVDGQRSREAIIAHVLAERPNLLPTPEAIREFVEAVLTRDCAV